MIIINSFFSMLFMMFIFFGCGAFVCSYIYPEKNKRNNLYIFSAPLFGIISLPPLIAFLYQIGLSFRLAAFCGVFVLFIFSAYRIPSMIRASLIPPPLHALPIIIATATASLCLIASVQLKTGLPSIELIDGSDVLGYANDADWLTFNDASTLPKKTEVYQLIPFQNLRHDQRYSAFIYLATASIITGHSALFSFPFACAVAMAIAAIGLPALSTSTILAFAFSSLGVLISAIFEYSHSGFLGKVLAFPSCLALSAAYITVCEKPNMRNNIILCWIALGSSVLHSFATSMVVLAVVFAASSSFSILTLYPKKDLQLVKKLIGRELWCFLPAFFVMFAGSGGFGVLLGSMSLDWQMFPLGINWPFQIEPVRLLLVVFDLDFFATPLRFINANSFSALAALAATLLVTIAIGAISIRLQNRFAFAFILGPMLFFVIISLFRPWGAYQTAGIPYLGGLMGVGALLSSHTAAFQRSILTRLPALVLVCLSTTFVALRLPKFVMVSERYHFTPSLLTMTESEFRELYNRIGDEPVLVDIEGVYYVQPLIVELGRMGTRLEFTPESWILTNWGLERPVYKQEPSLRIVLKERKLPGWETVYQDRNYSLLKRYISKD